MQIAMFSTKPYDQRFFNLLNRDRGHTFKYLEARLTTETAELAAESPAVCVFVNDTVDVPVLEQLAAGKTKLIALRCAGFNNVHLPTAAKLGLKVVRVPAYSPYAVAEHTIGLILTLNRKIHRAYNRVREGNFALDGLLGFDLHGTTAGVVGTGKIGELVVGLLSAFGCRILAHDPYPNSKCLALGAQYVPLDELLSQSDIISLHCPLTPDSVHLINSQTLQKMKPGAMLVNTSRGKLVNATHAIKALKSGHLGALAMDVYEEEEDTFFDDHSQEIMLDDVLARLLSFPNVLITGHQAFFTRNALESIAETTLGNVSAFEKGEPLLNEVKAS